MPRISSSTLLTRGNLDKYQGWQAENRKKYLELWWCQVTNSLIPELLARVDNIFSMPSQVNQGFSCSLQLGFWTDRFIIPVVLRGKMKLKKTEDLVKFTTNYPYACLIPEPVLHCNTPALTLPSVDSICIAKPVSHWESWGQSKWIFSCMPNVSTECAKGDRVMSKESSHISHDTLTAPVHKQLPILLQYQR